MKFLIYCMVYLGSALMVVNIYRYYRYAKSLQFHNVTKRDKLEIYIPIFLLVMFLFGYLIVGIYGKPDLVIAGILFGGSIFVFIIFLLLQRITNRIYENERLEAELMAAEESSRVKTSFLSSVSHEMRTPMNAIIGLDILALRNPDLPSETRTQLEQIGISARHLLGLIENILDMSQLDSETVLLREMPFSLDHALESVNIMIQSQCDIKEITYSHVIRGHLEEAYTGDELKLKQMLLSLLENAVKFTEKPGEVTFTTEQVESSEDGCRIRFTIKDTGIGISEEFLPRVFEAFAQEDASTTSQYGGNGLGLAIAKHIAELMGGGITVTSKKGQGSEFIATVTLKKAQEAAGQLSQEGYKAEAVQELEEALAGSMEDEEHVDLAGRRVLIVEDIDMNAEILADLLEMEDVLSERAENGQIAVNKFSQSPTDYYDAILMDLRMPVMDGLDATRNIRALNRADAQEIPIIAVTANAFEEDKKNALAAGMNMHMAKPVDTDLLCHLLEKEILRSQRHHRADKDPDGTSPSDQKPEENKGGGNTL